MEKKQTKQLKKRKKIDLVVPCYKATSTLERLLASVVMQSFKDKIQVILVQDCDGEDYSEIISNFKPMLDIKLIQFEKNMGMGAGRRIGRKSGKSKYVMYMDSDDTFQNPFAVEELYEAIEKGKFDAVNSVFLEQVGNLIFFPHNNNDWIWVFGKIYRRSFLEKHNIEMNDSRANEDAGFNAIVSTVGKVGFLNDTTYIWHYKEDSITRKDGGIYRFTGIEGWLYNMQYAIDNMVRLGAEEEKIQKFVAQNIMSTYNWFLEFGRDEDERVNVEEYKKWVNKYYKNIYLKHQPTKEQLNEMFVQMSSSCGISGAIPTHTFDQYLHMVGEGYNG